MEAAVLRGKCKKKLPVFLLLLLCVRLAMSAPATSSEGYLIGRNSSSHGNGDGRCRVGEYKAANGVCCNKCHAGEKLVMDCPENNKRTLCALCESGTFTDQINALRNCRRCRECIRDSEEELSPCKRDKDRECRCRKGYYRNVIDSWTHECLPCTNCKPECEDHCRPNTPPALQGTQKPMEKVYLVLLPVVVTCFVLLVVITYVTYLVTKKSVKRKIKLVMGDSSSSLEEKSQDSQKSTKSLIAYSECSEKLTLAIPTQECDSELPDCAPKEIKIQQLIYSVLDLVSVRHVKQLVRSLDVSERDIERAEVDYRSVQEANYQMLKLWAEGRAGGGTRGGARGGARGGVGRGVLQHAALQELLGKLREMDLGGVAEELEEKFGAQ